MADSSGKSDELKGRFHKAVGEVADDPALKHKGTVEKISGQVKQGIDHAKEKINKFIDHNKK